MEKPARCVLSLGLNVDEGGVAKRLLLASSNMLLIPHAMCVGVDIWQGGYATTLQSVWLCDTADYIYLVGSFRKL